MSRPYRRTYPPGRGFEVIARGYTAINKEKLHGRMLPATAYECRVCGKQAQDFHHPSYRDDDLLCVVPLCKKCHQRHHKSGLELPPLGIVPRPIGIIRIAIATSASSPD